MLFKKKGTIYQILDLLRGNNIFCIKYSLEEGCTKHNCIKRSTSINYLNTYIIFKEEDILKNETIISKFNSLGSKCMELNAEERLRIMHDFYRTGEETSFRFDLIASSAKSTK